MKQDHKIIIESLYDVKATCTCDKWWFVAVGRRTRREVVKEWRRHLPVKK